ncbi:hypothetical protein Poli38472_002623 [Pythium oligandrum]|uniref:Uncharacterized protein n=1 Tax=Pythium oligandrum TaxID=41045 RepID=A0A8K1CHV0_PYTOL|nr:hypothetical protein Poli38472_002623 [Pythium oligandrum]|eukprot:TMW63682.1 hypothetical protein Poli38472_002623 [Pythium oligandrum]
MRGLMRAIGLGGLLRNTPRVQETLRSQRSNGHLSALRPIDMGSLRSLTPRASEDRESDIRVSVERPQFLFFAGHDPSPWSLQLYAENNGQPALSTAKYPFVPSTVEPIRAPVISRQMPVFFAPQYVNMSFE